MRIGGAPFDPLDQGATKIPEALRRDILGANAARFLRLEV
jgi:hypothetical protein